MSPLKTAAPPQKVSRMNALKTFVEQIKSYGKFKERLKLENCIIEYYRIDTVTTAIIYYNLNGKPYKATFIYN